MRSRDDWNQSLYGRGYTIQEILLGTNLPIPQVAQGFIQTVAASTGPVVSQQQQPKPLALRRTRAAPESPGAAPLQLPERPRPHLRRGVSWP